jgi:maltose alpha-D-glucosyltransferase/alpha-amylase
MGVGLAADPLWYKDAIVYELRTRSYYDSNNDGIGDLAGLTTKLDYLGDLGITAIWILPHYPSPGRDDGYDIAGYTNVHPEIGTLGDFDALVEEAHRRGIRIITELVINHTSDQHPWFKRARLAASGSPERNFYVWSNTADGYEEARIIFCQSEKSNWTWDPVAKAYFWHRFYAHQPDLNFENPAVQEAVLGVVDFWLERGVDGLRLDAVPYLYERQGTNCENLPETHAFLKKLRAHVDGRFQDRLLLAEANQWPEDAARYFGDGDECHMTFHFPIMPRLFMSIQMEDRFPVVDILRQTPPLPANCQWAMFLRNHDELTLEMVTDEERDYMYSAYAHEPQMRFNQGIRRRLAALCGNDRRKMELLDALLFSMPGTPVLYYGDEIGMGDNVFLGDRKGVRTPMQWSPDRNAGFSRANPLSLDLPVIIDPEYHYEALNVEAQQSNPNSLLWWTKRLIALRKQYRAFGRGTVEFLHASNPSVLAFVRRHEDQVILVVANLSRRVQYVEIDLSEMKGRTPIELMGRTRFPAIGDGPYLVTLSGHAFYWLSLEQPRGPSPGERVSRLGTPTISITSPDGLLFGSERARLESILPAFLETRGWSAGTVSHARVTDTAQIKDAPATFLVFMRVEYTEGDSENFMIPLIVLAFDADLAQFLGETTSASPGAVIANLRLRENAGATPNFLLVLAAREGAGRILLDAIAGGASFRSGTGTVVAETMPGVTIDPEAGREARALSSDPLAASVAYGTSFVLRLFYRSEEGTAAELDVARVLAQEGHAGYMPRVLGWAEYRAPNREPVTLAVLEEQVANQGTAWQQACAELDRAYERVLARPAHEPPPTIPRLPLMDLVSVEPPEAHRELIGAYRTWAAKLGGRVAGFHLALASSHDPAFEPRAYSATDQRSRYQAARNLVGRVLGLLRQSYDDLPASAREAAGRVLAAEEEILARFEPLKTLTIAAKQIRIHGDLHLARVLFTGNDFILLGGGAAPRRKLSERKRKASALRDVASMVRSFQYAAAIVLRSLRDEDQTRAEPWSWIWTRWASAAFLRGYFETAGNAPFVAGDPAVTAVLLETALLSQALRDLRLELRRRSEPIVIRLHGILDILRS